jgi:hypothetical protein
MRGRRHAGGKSTPPDSPFARGEKCETNSPFIRGARMRIQLPLSKPGECEAKPPFVKGEAANDRTGTTAPLHYLALFIGPGPIQTACPVIRRSDRIISLGERKSVHNFTFKIRVSRSLAESNGVRVLQRKERTQRALCPAKTPGGAVKRARLTCAGRAREFDSTDGQRSALAGSQQARKF